MPKSMWRKHLKNGKIEAIKNPKTRADIYSTIRRIAKKRFEDIRLIIENLPEKQLDQIMLDPDVFPAVRVISYGFYLANERKREQEKQRRKAILAIKRNVRIIKCDGCGRFLRCDYIPENDKWLCAECLSRREM